MLWEFALTHLCTMNYDHARSKKAKYACLSEVFLLVSKVFKRLQDEEPSMPELRSEWPRDKVLKKGCDKSLSGRDVFSTCMYKRTRIGESSLERSARVGRVWLHEMTHHAKRKFEARADEHNRKIRSRQQAFK